MFCTKCGKKIPDNSKFCPYCGTLSDHVVQMGQPPQNKNLSYVKFIVIGLSALVVLIFIGVGVGMGMMNMANKQSLASDGGPDGTWGSDNHSGWMRDTSEEAGDDSWPGRDDGNSDDANWEEDSGKDNENAQWADNKSYKAAYEEEYASFESIVQEYCEQSSIEYMENIDEYADQIDEAYQLIEEAVPGFSDMLAKDIGSLADSETGAAIIEKVAGAALNNEDVRKTAYKMTMVAADSLLEYVMNSMTTDDPYVFDLIEMNGDFALLRSAGTYDDFCKITKQNLAYDTKINAAQWRIDGLESAAQNVENDDEYAQYMGRIAADHDRAKEVEELFVKAMAAIACSGNYYCSAQETGSPKLYMVAGKDGTIYNTFWAPGLVKSESSAYFDISINNQGDCFLTGAQDRFVMDHSGTVLFEGNSFTEREDEAEGESIILAYGPEQIVLRETKKKDSVNGQYYTLEIEDQNGNIQKLLDVKDLDRDSIVSGLDYDDVRGIQWKNDSMSYSDYILLSYISLEEEEEREMVIDLSLGQVYSRSEFQNLYDDTMSRQAESYAQLCEQGTPQDGWVCNVQTGEIFVNRTSASLEFLSGLSQERSKLDTDRTGFNTDVLLDTIGESRKIQHWYCKDNILWIVTSSGYFYTYDLEGRQKSNEVEIGETSPYYFTPYGLLVCSESMDKGFSNTDAQSGNENGEYTVYQYDASGNVIGTYPVYNNRATGFDGNTFGFLYCNGKDTYNIATQTILRLD